MNTNTNGLVLKQKRGRKAMFTKEQVQEMVQLNQQGYTLASIAVSNKTTEATICRNIQKLRMGGFE